MLSRALFLLLILFSGTIQANEFPIEIIEYTGNTKIVAFFNESDIDKKLHWMPVEGAPPLTITDALVRIREHVAADPELVGATVTEIDLKQIPRHAGHWHYLVKMKGLVDSRMHAHYFIVLMNGKIIQGLREPESIK